MRSVFKIFFPSWKFFDQLGSSPQLLFRIKSTVDDQFDEWKNLTTPLPRRLSLFFINADGNLKMACDNHLHRTMIQVSQLNLDAEIVEASVDYHIIKNMVEFHLKEVLKPSAPMLYQFKINIVNRSSSGDSSNESSQNDFLTSRVYSL